VEHIVLWKSKQVSSYDLKKAKMRLWAAKAKRHPWVTARHSERAILYITVHRLDAYACSRPSAALRVKNNRAGRVVQLCGLV
jgi:hypothetical protein